MKLEPLYRSIGSAIRGKRRQLDWSQEKLARKLMISRGTLANIEAGRQRILVHQLYAIAAALDLRPSDLLLTIPAVAPPAANLEALPLPHDLNAQQKEQLSRLIQSVEATHSPLDRYEKK